MEKKKNFRFKILIFLLIICSLIIEFYPYKDAIAYYCGYDTTRKNYIKNTHKDKVTTKNNESIEKNNDKKDFTNIYSGFTYQKLYLGKSYYKNGNLKTHNYLDNSNKKLISESYYEDGTLLSKSIYNDISMSSDSEYYIEYRKDGTKFCEVQKIDKYKELEKIFDRNGTIIYENIMESDF